VEKPIPISFEWQGKSYQGYFELVSGAGTSGMYFLTINSRHAGMLWNTQNFGWQFGNQKDHFLELKDYFVEVLIAWYQ
jgi:hypothetical protein